MSGLARNALLDGDSTCAECFDACETGEELCRFCEQKFGERESDHIAECQRGAS